MDKIEEIESELEENKEKLKQQQKLNVDLKDKIQQIEFEKDMMHKENENLKRRTTDF